MEKNGSLTIEYRVIGTDQRWTESNDPIDFRALIAFINWLF